MAYSTKADILNQIEEALLIELTDDERTGEVSDARVSRAIDDADQFIDGHLGGHYSVPLSPIPPLLRQLSVALAIYALYERRDTVPDTRTERFKWAIDTLKQISKGIITLGASDPDGNPPTKSGIAFSSAPEVFSPERMRRY